MKLFSAIILLLVTYYPLNGQPIESLYESNEALEKQAIRLTEIYDAELALTAEQRVLFQKKVESFLIKSNIVRDNYEGKQRLDALYRLQKEEIGDMDDILTQIQWRRYVEIRPKIQPLDEVKS